MGLVDLALHRGLGVLQLFQPLRVVEGSHCQAKAAIAPLKFTQRRVKLEHLAMATAMKRFEGKRRSHHIQAPQGPARLSADAEIAAPPPPVVNVKVSQAATPPTPPRQRPLPPHPVARYLVVEEAAKLVDGKQGVAAVVEIERLDRGRRDVAFRLVLINDVVLVAGEKVVVQRLVRRVSLLAITNNSEVGRINRWQGAEQAADVAPPPT